MRTRTRLPLALLVALAVVNVPPWLMYKGNTIASVCAIDIPAGSATTPAAVAGNEPVQVADAEEEQSILDPKAAIVPASSLSSNEQEAAEATVAEPKSDDAFDGSRLTPSLQATIITNDLTAEEEVAPLEPEPEVVSPPDAAAPAPPRRARYSHTYYVKLSAEPGTEEARVQHANVARALMALPGTVTIRHEFGMDVDDVLNVISFKVEGSGDGLEQVAALEGVIGIYPVVSTLGSLQTPL